MGGLDERPMQSEKMDKLDGVGWRPTRVDERGIILGLSNEGFVRDDCLRHRNLAKNGVNLSQSPIDSYTTPVISQTR